LLILSSDGLAQRHSCQEGFKYEHVSGGGDGTKYSERVLLSGLIFKVLL